MDFKKNLIDKLVAQTQPQNWEEIKQNLDAKPITDIGNKPVYKFFQTLNEDLKIVTPSIAVSVQPRNSYIPYHIHDYAEMTIPLIGSCEVTIDHQKIKVDTEDICLIGKGTIHTVKPASKNDLIINIALRKATFTLNDLNFMLHSGVGQSISNMLFCLLSSEQESDNLFCLFKTKKNPKISYLLYDIIQEYFYPKFQTERIIRLDLMSLFSHLLRQAAQDKNFIKTEEKKQANLLSMLLYIETNYSNITLQEMAKHFGFNPNYLSAYLKKKTGLPFIKLVHLQRINIAADYLANTSAAIDKIALKVGYENPSYFYKIFRKIIGVSPTEYRSNLS